MHTNDSGPQANHYKSFTVVRYIYSLMEDTDWVETKCATSVFFSSGMAGPPQSLVWSCPLSPGSECWAGGADASALLLVLVPVSGVGEDAGGAVNLGKVVRPLRSVDPTQTEYQGLIDVTDEGGCCQCLICN